MPAARPSECINGCHRMIRSHILIAAIFCLVVPSTIHAATQSLDGIVFLPDNSCYVQHPDGHIILYSDATDVSSGKKVDIPKGHQPVGSGAFVDNTAKSILYLKGGKLEKHEWPPMIDSLLRIHRPSDSGSMYFYGQPVRSPDFKIIVPGATPRKRLATCHFHGHKLTSEGKGSSFIFISARWTKGICTPRIDGDIFFYRSDKPYISYTTGYSDGPKNEAVQSSYPFLLKNSDSNR